MNWELWIISFAVPTSKFICKILRTAFFLKASGIITIPAQIREPQNLSLSTRAAHELNKNQDQSSIINHQRQRNSSRTLTTQAAPLTPFQIHQGIHKTSQSSLLSVSPHIHLALAATPGSTVADNNHQAQSQTAYHPGSVDTFASSPQLPFVSISTYEVAWK